MNKNNHGGQRDGAGRPILPKSKRKKLYAVALTEAQRRYTLRLGRTVGAGIRKLLDVARGAGK